MLIKRRAWERIGLFDGAMFLYWKDTEYCWRAVLRGLNVLLAARADVHHESGGIARRAPNRRRIEAEKVKNKLYTYEEIRGSALASILRLWFYVRAVLRPWKNGAVRDGLRLFREVRPRIPEARRRDVGEPTARSLAQLRALRRSDRRITKLLRALIRDRAAGSSSKSPSA